jgi:hypothetical protein
MDTKQQGLAAGAIRLGVGAALVAAPGWAGRIWVGPGADGAGSKVFARAVGARDLALGARILQASRNGGEAAEWLKSGYIADIADAVATVIAFRHLTKARRIAMPLIAGAVGVLGYLAASGGD